MRPLRQFQRDMYSAGQPTPGDLEAFAARGVKTVINLRAMDEVIGYDEAAETARLGMHYVQIPINGPTALDHPTIKRFASAMDDAGREGAVLIHCGTGNRVGAAIALQRGWLDGCDPIAALELGRAAGLQGLEPVVARLLHSR